MKKNVASQKWRVFAYGLPDHASPGEPVTGDAAQISAKISKDGAALSALGDAAPVELEDGFYEFDLTQAETNAHDLLLSPESSTAEVQVIGVPGNIVTTPQYFSELGVLSGGEITQVNALGGNTITSAAIQDDAIAVGKIATDAINADVLAADAVTEIQSGLSTFDPSADDVAKVTLVDTTTDVTNEVTADAVKISGDGPAADNLESMYDGSGYLDPAGPARQDQVGALSTGAGGLSVNASGVNVTTGTETNAYTDTFAAGTIHIVSDDTGTLFEYEFDLSAYIGTGTIFRWTGYVQTINDTVDLQYYDWVATAWVTLKTLAGAIATTLGDETLDIPVAATGIGANLGLCKLRFTSSGGTATTNIGTDRVRLIFTQASTGIDNGSTVTLSGDTLNKNFVGNNWILVLGGQNISGSYFKGASVTGIASGTTEVSFEDCHFGACTLPPGTYIRCGFGDADGLVTAASAGEYVFKDCYSIVAGSGTPDFTFAGKGAATGINNRGWFGGYSVTLDTDCTISHEVVGGGGVTVNSADAAVEIRGLCRSITLNLADTDVGNTIQVIAETGPVIITSAGSGDSSTINLYGSKASIADGSSGGTTVNDFMVVKSDIDAILVDTGTTLPAEHALLGTEAKQDTIISEIGTAGAGLTDLGGMSTAMKAEVQSEANDALVAIHLDHLLAVAYPADSEPGHADSWINFITQDNGATKPQFTVDALENAPSGTAASRYEVLGSCVQDDDGSFYWCAWLEFNGQPQTAVTNCRIDSWLFDGDGTITDLSITETVANPDAHGTFNGTLSPTIESGVEYKLRAIITYSGTDYTGIIPFASPVRATS